MRRRRFVGALAAVPGVIAGCTDGEADGADGDEGEPTEADEPVAIVDHELDRKYEGDDLAELVLVRGRAENVGDEPLERVAIRVRFYDEAGEERYSTVATGDDLAPGETFSFEVEYQYQGLKAQRIDDHAVEVAYTR